MIIRLVWLLLGRLMGDDKVDIEKYVIPEPTDFSVRGVIERMKND